TSCHMALSTIFASPAISSSFASRISRASGQSEGSLGVSLRRSSASSNRRSTKAEYRAMRLEWRERPLLTSAAERNGLAMNRLKTPVAEGSPGVDEGSSKVADDGQKVAVHV